MKAVPVVEYDAEAKASGIVTIRLGEVEETVQVTVEEIEAIVAEQDVNAEPVKTIVVGNVIAIFPL